MPGFLVSVISHLIIKLLLEIYYIFIYCLLTVKTILTNSWLLQNLQLWTDNIEDVLESIYGDLKKKLKFKKTVFEINEFEQ